MERAFRKYDLALLIAAAVLIRLAAALACMHLDVVFVHYFPAKFAYEGIFDIYGHIVSHFGVTREGGVYYPPMTFLTLAFFQTVMKPMAYGFHAWISQAYTVGLDKWLLENGTSLALIRYLFLMKLPYVFFDVLCAAVLVWSTDDGAQRRRALSLWVFNPVVIYGVYMFGQVDLMPAALLALAVLMMEREREKTAFALLTTAVLFKTFAIFVIPPLLLLSRKSMLKNIVAAAAPFAVLAPFIVLSGTAVMSSLLPKFYSENMISVSCLSFYRFIAAAFFLMLCYKCIVSRKGGYGPDALGASIAAILFLYLTLFVAVRYFVWITPLLVLAVARGRIPSYLYWILILSLFAFNLYGQRHTFWFFAPIDPEFFLRMPDPVDLMHSFGIRWGYVLLAGQMCFMAMSILVGVTLAGLAPSFAKALGIKVR